MNKLLSLAPVVLSALLGALLPLSLAPYDYWPLAPLALAAWFYICLAQPEHILRHSFGFGFGLFASGASWVYVSIHDFGLSSAPLAFCLTLVFIAALGVLFALPFYLFLRLQKILLPKLLNNKAALALALASVYLLGEWSRGWLFSGFPWLYLGYGHLETPLSAWASIGGVLLVSYWLCLSASALALIIWCWKDKAKSRTALTLAAVATLPWVSGGMMHTIEWASPKGEAITVGMVQANIPQELKWDPSFRQATIERYDSMSEALWHNDWVIWPEAAIPLPLHRAESFYQTMAAKAKASNSTLITGSLVRENGRYHNSAVAMGLGEGVYHKRKLVPFGEYVPLEDYLRGVIGFFNLPTSVIKPGPDNYSKIYSQVQMPALGLTPLICYEIVYPELARAQGDEHPVLITLSNDAWFGASIGPLQHMQMAQMRALENHRYLIRATNTGVSAVVSPRGKLLAKSEQFVQQILQGQVYAMTGSTPFARWGQLIVLLLSMLGLAAAALLARITEPRPQR